MPDLVLYEDYSRDDVHDIFDPDSTFTPRLGLGDYRALLSCLSALEITSFS